MWDAMPCARGTTTWDGIHQISNGKPDIDSSYYSVRTN